MDAKPQGNKPPLLADPDEVFSRLTLDYATFTGEVKSIGIFAEHIKAAPVKRADQEALADFARRCRDVAKELTSHTATEALPFAVCVARVKLFFDELAKIVEDAKGKADTMLASIVKPKDPLRTNRGTTVSLVEQAPGFEIAEPAKVPKQYLSPDHAKIAAAIKAGAVVPGVRLIPRSYVTVKGPQ
jgi:hypothetical protein